MIFHDFAKTSCFRAPFCVDFGQFRCFLLKERYSHVHCCEIHSHIKLRTRIHRKKWRFSHSTDAEPWFFTILLSNQFPNSYVFAVILAQFGLGVAQWIAAWAADFSHKSMQQIGVLETWTRKNMWKHRVLHQGAVETLFFAAFSCR